MDFGVQHQSSLPDYIKTAVPLFAPAVIRCNCYVLASYAYTPKMHCIIPSDRSLALPLSSFGGPGLCAGATALERLVVNRECAHITERRQTSDSVGVESNVTVSIWKGGFTLAWRL